MTRDEWLDIGVRTGWVAAVCFMHDGMPTFTESEAAAFDYTDDPCVHRWVVQPTELR